MPSLGSSGFRSTQALFERVREGSVLGIVVVLLGRRQVRAAPSAMVIKSNRKGARHDAPALSGRARQIAQSPRAERNACTRSTLVTRLKDIENSVQSRPSVPVADHRAGAVEPTSPLP